MNEQNGDWWSSLEDALSTGEPVVETISEFDEACEHVVSLLRDASMMLASGSDATATLLAITALEETAKIHVGMFRRGSKKVSRRQDPLHHHKAKHRLALGPTLSMGKRLQEAVGSDRLTELLKIGQAGGFVSIRESALYVGRSELGLSTPKKVISSEMARELVLLAIEGFDDALVGYTNQTFILSGETDRLFDLAAAHNPQFASDKSKKAP